MDFDRILAGESAVADVNGSVPEVRDVLNPMVTLLQEEKGYANTDVHSLISMYFITKSQHAV